MRNDRAAELRDHIADLWHKIEEHDMSIVLARAQIMRLQAELDKLTTKER